MWVSELFGDDTSLFSMARDFNSSVSDVKKDLKFIRDWAFQWKMSFDLHLSKQAQEITINRKNMKSSHPSVHSNNTPVSSTWLHNRLGMLLDDKFSCEHHLKFALNKVKRLTSQKPWIH